MIKNTIILENQEGSNKKNQPNAPRLGSQSPLHFSRIPKFTPLKILPFPFTVLPHQILKPSTAVPEQQDHWENLVSDFI
ncbi:hypothetical protein HN873_043576 [Arachis hypogaea]